MDNWEDNWADDRAWASEIKLHLFEVIKKKDANEKRCEWKKDANEKKMRTKKVATFLKGH